jgi:hypothetical protein
VEALYQAITAENVISLKFHRAMKKAKTSPRINTDGTDLREIQNQNL